MECVAYCFKCKSKQKLEEVSKVDVDADDTKWRRMKGKEMLRGKCIVCKTSCCTVRGLGKAEEVKPSS